MQDVKVTVVTVCYNSAKTIEQTIQSVLGQSYKNLEYIIIDGESTDGTIDIIKQYEDDIDYWVSEPDHGIYDAMNKGIKKATGDVIGFLNSDDWYADGAISMIAKAFFQTDADVVYGRTLILGDDTQRLMPSFPLENLLYAMIFCHQSVFSKTSLMKKNPFNISWRIAADYAFLLEMYLQGKKFYGIDVVISHFRKGGLSSHPWKTYMEIKVVALRVTSGRIGKEQYMWIRKNLREQRCLYIFRFLRNRIGLKMKGNPYNRMLVPFAKRGFILYGAGVFGAEVLRVIRTIGFHVDFFWDSDKSKQGKDLEGIPILYPTEKMRNAKEAVILVTVAKDGGKVGEVLEDLGYERKRDFFDKDDWIGWIARMWILGKNG